MAEAGPAARGGSPHPPGLRARFPARHGAMCPEGKGAPVVRFRPNPRLRSPEAPPFMGQVAPFLGARAGWFRVLDENIREIR